MLLLTAGVLYAQNDICELKEYPKYKGKVYHQAVYDYIQYEFRNSNDSRLYREYHPVISFSFNELTEKYCTCARILPARNIWSQAIQRKARSLVRWRFSLISDGLLLGTSNILKTPIWAIVNTIIWGIGILPIANMARIVMRDTTIRAIITTIDK